MRSCVLLNEGIFCTFRGYTNKAQFWRAIDNINLYYGIKTTEYTVSQTSILTNARWSNSQYVRVLLPQEIAYGRYDPAAYAGWNIPCRPCQIRDATRYVL